MGTRVRNLRGNVDAWLAHLFAMLSAHPLSPAFEDYGNFIITSGEDLRPGEVRFWGNFWAYSNVFHVITDDPVLITRLTMAIRANQGSHAYQEARKADRRIQADRRERALRQVGR